MTTIVLAEVDSDADVDGTPAVPADDADELRNLFDDYNPDVWPLHLVTYALGLVAIALIVRRPGPATDRFVTGVLAGVWAWLGIVFFGRYASQIDPLLSAVYGALFLFQAALLPRSGLARGALRFGPSRGLAGRIGWAALANALVVYPALGIVLGHGYPESPLFGMAPCPTTIATFGLLLLAAPPLPAKLLVIPTIWAVLATLAAVGHGYPEDIGLFLAAVATWVAIVGVGRPTRRTESDHVIALDVPTREGARA